MAGPCERMETEMPMSDIEIAQQAELWPIA